MVYALHLCIRQMFSVLKVLTQFTSVVLLDIADLKLGCASRYHSNITL
jgi:hypothetical protein